MFTRDQSIYFYEQLSSWLTEATAGRCNPSKSWFKEYQKTMWQPLYETIGVVSKKGTKSSIDKDFLDMVVYDGPVYRLQHYYPRYKGHVWETEYCQSWSKNTRSLSTVNGYYGEVLLIVGKAIHGISTFGLLEFLSEVLPFKTSESLERYREEQEIAHPMLFDRIEEIVIIDTKHLCSWELHKKLLPKEKWKRKAIN